jgi:hypothetical protein
MDTQAEGPPMNSTVPRNATKRSRKQRSDVKLTSDKLATIERCLRLGMTHDDISAITSINRSTVAAVKLVLGYLGRL